MRKLTESMKGRPFVLLGIVGDGRNDDARKVIASESIAWPNVLEGGQAVVDRYHIEGFPSHVVVDAEGMIRAKDRYIPEDLSTFLEPFVKEAEAAAKKAPPG